MNCVTKPTIILVKPFFLLLMIIKGSYCASVVMRFQDHITHQASRLGDVLAIDNDEHDWANLPLASRPVAGELLTKEVVLNWLTGQTGSVNYRWQGKTQTRIHATHQSSSDALINLAKTALAKRLKPYYNRVTITAISVPKDSEYPLNEFKTQITVRFPTSKRSCVWLIHDKQRIAIWFRVRAYALVLVAQHRLKANSMITKADVAWQEQDIAGLREAPAQALADNTWLTSTLEPDGVLLASQLGTSPAVLHGQTINVTMHTHRIQVTMTAIALHDGYLGQTILVKNPSNQQLFSVTVTGSKEARVKL